MAASTSNNDVKTSPAERPLPREGRRTIGPYVLKGVLGRGGMAVVYRAVGKDGASVALKVMEAASLDGTSRTRFEREAQVMSGLEHPGIVRVIDQGVDEEEKRRPLLYYAMELIGGWTLHELLLRRQRLWLSQAARVTHDAAEALAVVHARGIIHRDVKPSNVFVTTEGRVVVADFGVCLVPDATPVTKRGQVWGTLAFLSPEQLMGQRADPRSDVFSLGALLFTLATGKLIRDPTIPPWMNGEPENPANRVREMRDLPSGLARVLRSALHEDPAERPAHAGMFASALAPFIGDVPSPLDASPEPPREDVDGAQPIPYAAAADTGALDVAGADDVVKAVPPKESATVDEPTPTHLVQTTDPGRGTVFPLRKDSIRIGRAPGNDLVLDEKSVSGLHALIVKRGQRYFIDDQDSSNGLRVNGIGVPSAFLHKGDLLMVGLVGLQVVGGDEDVEAVRRGMLAPVPAPRRRALGEGQRERPAFQGLSYSDGAVIGVMCAIVGAALGYLLGR